MDRKESLFSFQQQTHSASRAKLFRNINKQDTNKNADQRTSSICLLTTSSKAENHDNYLLGVYEMLTFYKHLGIQFSQLSY